MCADLDGTEGPPSGRLVGPVCLAGVTYTYMMMLHVYILLKVLGKKTCLPTQQPVPARCAMQMRERQLTSFSSSLPGDAALRLRLSCLASANVDGEPDALDESGDMTRI